MKPRQKKLDFTERKSVFGGKVLCKGVSGLPPSSHIVATGRWCAGVKATQSSSSFAQRQKLIFYRTENFAYKASNVEKFQNFRKTFCENISKLFEDLNWSEMDFSLKRELKRDFLLTSLFSPMQYGGQKIQKFF